VSDPTGSLRRNDLVLLLVYQRREIPRREEARVDRVLVEGEVASGSEIGGRK
jgi:hypothetical protein